MILPWHQNAFNKLDKMIKKNHLAHALLISGPEKIGKINLTMHFIKTILCKDNGCDNCYSCRQINNDNPKENLNQNVLIRRSNYPNMIFCRTEITEYGKQSENIKVDQIRKFCEVLHKTAEGLQIGIIFYADQMNINAANCLLKTLEEPRDNTLIILLAHNIDKVIPTILSRCQNVHIPATFAKDSANWITKNSKKDIDYDALKLLENCHGIPFKALDYLDNDDIIKINNYREKLIKIALNPNEIITNKLNYESEIDILECLQNIIIETIRLKLTKIENELCDLSKIVKKSCTNNLFLLLKDVSYSIKLAKTNVDEKLLLDNILIIWSNINNIKNYPYIFKN